LGFGFALASAAPTLKAPSAIPTLKSILMVTFVDPLRLVTLDRVGGYLPQSRKSLCVFIFSIGIHMENFAYTQQTGRASRATESVIDGRDRHAVPQALACQSDRRPQPILGSYK